MADIALRIGDRYLDQEQQAIFEIVENGPDRFVANVEDTQRELRDDRLKLSAELDLEAEKKPISQEL